MKLKSGEIFFLFVVVLFGLTLRFIYFSDLSKSPYFTNPRVDAYYYDRWARSIAAGDVVGEDVFFRAPFYAYWLAWVYSCFGNEYVSSRIVQLLMGGGGGLIAIYLIARKVFNPRVAIVSTLFALLNPVLIHFEGQLLLESLLTAFCLAFLLIATNFRHDSRHHPFALGLLYGLICITRPTFLVLLPLLLGILSSIYFQKILGAVSRTYAIKFLIATCIVIFPVTIRNYVVGKDFVVVASQGGINFFIGNNPQADGFTARMPTTGDAGWAIAEQTHEAEKELGHRPLPSEESMFWFRKGVNFILQEPLTFVRLEIKKIYLFWNNIEIPNDINFYSMKEYSAMLGYLPVEFGVLAMLGIPGMALSWRFHRARLLTCFVLGLMFVVVLFFVCDRYRVPVIPALCILSGVTLVRIVELIKSKQWKPVFFVLSSVFVIGINAYSNIYGMVPTNRYLESYYLGLISQEQGNHAKAVRLFQNAALAHSPIRNLQLHLAISELSLGQSNKALQSLHAELQFFPKSRAALGNLAAIHLANGSSDSAVIYASNAIAVYPSSSDPYVIAANAFLRMSQHTQAESVLTVGARECGNGFLEGRCLLADIHAENGDFEKAKGEYFAVLQGVSSFREHDYEPQYLLSKPNESKKESEELKGKALYGLGRLFITKNNIDSAGLYLEMATKILVRNPGLWSDLGIAYLRQRKLSEANLAIDQALELDSLDYRIWYNKAVILGYNGQLEESMGALSKALKLNPGFSLGSQKLAEVQSFLRKRR